MRNHRRSALAAALLLTTLSGACVIGYEVTVTNRLDVPVVVELSQYRAADFSATPPKEFTPDLLVEIRNVSLGAGESTKVDFNNAAGGFWVRWRLADSPVRESEAAALDLLRDRLTIVVSATVDSAARSRSRVAARHLMAGSLSATTRSVCWSGSISMDTSHRWPRRSAPRATIWSGRTSWT